MTSLRLSARLSVKHRIATLGAAVAVLAGTAAAPPALAAAGHKTVRAATRVAMSYPSATAPFAVGISPGGNLLQETPTAVGSDLAGMAAAGDRWVRIDVPWFAIEASPGTYSWTSTDTAIRDALADGLTVDAILAYAPAWATSATGQPNATDYGTFATAAAKRYGPLGVHVWELWNEENLGWTWNNEVNVSSYGTVMEAGYKAVHAADSHAVALLGGLGRGPNVPPLAVDPYDFLAQLYAGGYGRYFDAVAVHPYTAPYGPTSTDPNYGLFSQLPQFRSLMVSYGDSAKKIWLTEYGFPTANDPDAVTEAEQASWIGQAVSIARGYSWVGPMFVYNWHDDASQDYGLLRLDGSAKPAYSVFQQAPH